MPRLYAETSTMRTRQIVWDLTVVAWIVFWVWLGMHLHDLVVMLAVPGERLADVGTSLASGAQRIAGAVDRTPLVGSGIAAPFTALGDAAGGLAGAGEAMRQAAHRLAWWLSIAAAGTPITLVLAPYLLARRRWVRRAAEASQRRDDPGTIRLLALRAVVSRPLEQLHGVSQDPMRDLEERPELLAALELRDLGLRSPA